MRLLFHTLFPFTVAAFHLLEFDCQRQRNRNHHRQTKGRYHQAEEGKTENMHSPICTDCIEKSNGLRLHFFKNEPSLLFTKMTTLLPE